MGGFLVFIRVDSRDSRGEIVTEELIYREECYKIVGACFELYNDKGCGFLEPVYQEFLKIELAHHGIPFAAQQRLPLSHRGQRLKQFYTPDFICYGKILLEIKAVSTLADEHRAQVINYLNVTGFELGLLVNFGSYPKLQWERLVFTKRNLPANHAKERE